VQERGAKAGEVSRRIVLRTARLILARMTPLDEAEHAAASGDPAAALRDTRAAEVQWREYGFGPWAIRDLRDECFLGGAELRLAGDGIEGIAPDEVEAGWWVTKERRNQGIGSERCTPRLATSGIGPTPRALRPTSRKVTTRRRAKWRSSSDSWCVARVAVARVNP